MNQLPLTHDERAVLLAVLDACLAYFPPGDPEYGILIGDDRDDLLALRALVASLPADPAGDCSLPLDGAARELLSALLLQAIHNFLRDWSAVGSEEVARRIDERLRALPD